MKRRRSVSRTAVGFWLGATACFTVACGGDDGKPAGSSSDTKPPTFAGLSEAVVLDESRVQLSWEPAADETSRPGRIAYAIYAGPSEGRQDFDQPFGFTPAGASGAILSGLVPTQDYYWVVRAIDEAGNEDENVVEQLATPPDESPPRFAGLVNATAKTSHSLFVEWKPARDNATAEADMRYRVYVSSAPSVDTFAFDDPDVESAPGESSAIVDGFDPLTDYYVIVRAVDRADQEESNVVMRSTKTPEGVPPIFGGIKQANSIPAGVKLYWLPAEDDGTEAANMVYNVHVSEQEVFSSAALSTPAHTTEPAALSFVVPGLQAGKRYWFIVRAQDTAGNTDANTNAASVLAIGGNDTAAPTFDGVTAVSSDSPSTLRVEWEPAIDNVTPATHLVYDIFVQDQPGGPAGAEPVPTLVSRPGASSATITGLPPQATRFVVVRARDAAGNSLANNTELSGSTLARPASDLVAPVWGGGAPTAEIPATGEMKRPQKLVLTWSAATDDQSAATDIRYHVCAEPLEGNCLGTLFNKHIRASSDWGATSFTLAGLHPRTRYFVYVRAEDRSGNIETGTHGVSRTTATSYLVNIQPILVDKCNGCHSFGLGTMVDVPGGYVDPRLPDTRPPEARTGLKLIDPGFPENSLIYRRINPRGLTIAPFSESLSNQYGEAAIQEPRDGIGTRTQPLSGAEDGAIRDWIFQGAWGD